MQKNLCSPKAIDCIYMTCIDILAEPPSMGLYFNLSGTIYLSGDVISITSIGSSIQFDPEINPEINPGSPLICVTTNVNTECCRSDDGSNVGEWFFPNGAMVSRNRYSSNETDFTRTGHTHHVLLNRKNAASVPIGVFTCEVPDGEDGEVIHRATITLSKQL